MRKQQKSSMSAKKRLAIIFITLFISSIASTQIIAWKFNYHAALGQKIHEHIYWPWAWITWSIEYHSSYKQILSAGWLVMLITSSVGFLILAVMVNMASRNASSIADLHGSAHWASLDDIKAAELLTGKGVYVGAWEDEKGKTHYLRHDGPEHIIAFAPTRSGKGVGLVLPTLLSWTESAVIYDIKGENWALTAGWRQKYANNLVLNFDPANPEHSCAYNPLAAIRIDSERAVGDVQNIATIIVDPNGKGLESHWDKTAFALLTGAILHTLYKVRKEENRTANLSDVATLLANPEMPIGDVLEEMLVYQHITDSNGRAITHPTVAQEARAMLNKAEEELSSVVSTAIANLSLYRDPIVARNTAHSDFAIEDLMQHERAITLYIVDRPSDTDRMRPLIRLMITQIIRRLTERMEFEGGRSVKHYKNRLLLLLDEFPALKKLTMVEDGLAFMAGYGLKAYLICQDVQQLTGIYTRDEKIMANCHIRIGYAPNKLETAEMLSKMSGTATVIKEDISISGTRFGGAAKTYNKSYREHQRPLITADEVMRLKKPRKSGHGSQEKIVDAGELLIFAAGYAPVFGKQILYFQDEIFQARANVPAPEKSDLIFQTQDTSSVKSEFQL